MKNGMDKRIVKTMQAIRSAFIQLVQEKNMVEISISELTKTANVTRSTFYMYYSSISAVRDEIENEVVKSLDKFMSGGNIKDVYKNPYPFLRELSNKIMSYDEMNHYLVCGKDSGQLFDKIKNYAVNAFVNLVPESRTADRVNAKYVSTFLCAGILDSYKEWFLNQDSIALEELCKRFSDIIIENAKLVKCS